MEYNDRRGDALSSGNVESGLPIYQSHIGERLHADRSIRSGSVAILTAIYGAPNTARASFCHAGDNYRLLSACLFRRAEGTLALGSGDRESLPNARS